MKNIALQFALLLCTAFLLAANATAQNPVSLSASVSPGSIPAGGKATVKVTASMAGGWHLYSLTQGAGGPIPTRITVPEGQSFKLAGSPTGPRPRVAMDPNFEINTETYEGAVTFSVPISVAADAVSGAQTLNVNVRFQTCNDKSSICSVSFNSRTIHRFNISERCGCWSLCCRWLSAFTC